MSLKKFHKVIYQSYLNHSNLYPHINLYFLRAAFLYSECKVVTIQNCQIFRILELKMKLWDRKGQPKHNNPKI